jgi:hypothetical protein
VRSGFRRGRGVIVKEALVSLSAILIVACAVVQPPSGGPEDRQPPYILEIVPAPDSVGVADDTNIAMRFSEKVNAESFKERVKLFPPVAFESIKVKGAELRIRFAEALPETTMTLLLSGGYKDLHGVPNRNSDIFHFSTTDALQEGKISGWVFFKEEADSTGVVKLYQVVADSSISFKMQPESRIAFASRDGSFAFRALPTDSARFLLWAFSDKNMDGNFAEEKEFFLLHPDTIVLTKGKKSAREIHINIIDPKEPGSITGRVIDETGLELLPTVRFSPMLPGEPTLVVRADSTGNFLAPKVPPGRYVVSVFIDVAQDSLCGSYIAPYDSTVTLEEPCMILSDTLLVKPGGEIGIGVVKLEKDDGHE